MQLHKDLTQVFELSTIDFDKANRKTLLKYAIRSKFQLRREAFYSICSQGKKSKVSFCKKEERPQWNSNLETLKTKQLRKQLKGFITELGLFQKPTKGLAKKKNWEAVLDLYDTSKTGGGHWENGQWMEAFEGETPDYQLIGAPTRQGEPSPAYDGGQGMGGGRSVGGTPSRRSRRSSRTVTMGGGH